MRLGLSNFLNSKPYYSLAEHFEALFAPPKMLKKAFFEGHLDISLLSSDAFLSAPHLHPFPLGIGAGSSCPSVLLFLAKPQDPLLDITVTAASETSVQLLRIILEHFWQRPYRLHVSHSPFTSYSSGYLLIGDEALFHKSSLPCYDLAALWHQCTGLPFIFALYVAKKASADFEEKARDALHHFFKNIEQEEQKAYFRSLDYYFSDKHFEGMALFHELRQKLPSFH